MFFIWLNHKFLKKFWNHPVKQVNAETAYEKFLSDLDLITTTNHLQNN